MMCDAERKRPCSQFVKKRGDEIINVNELLSFFDPTLSFPAGLSMTQNRVKTHNMTLCLTACVYTFTGAHAYVYTQILL